MPNRTIIALFPAVFAVLIVFCGNTEPELTNSLDRIIAPGDTLTKVNIDFTFDGAGSLFWDDGYLYFANSTTPPENSVTYRMSLNGSVTSVREHNGRTMSIAKNTKGTFYSCDMLLHQITEFDRDGNVLGIAAGAYRGVRLDSPNDLLIDETGGFYFSDTHSGADAMQDTSGVYYVKPDGTVIREIEDIEFPNGIACSPDGKVLYVTNTRGADKARFVFAYDINPDKTLSTKRRFCELVLTPQNEENPQGTAGADACVVDIAGNLYVATMNGIGIQVFNAAGQHLGNIAFTGRSNCCRFGGPDMKTLFVSARDGIYTIKTRIPGLKTPPDPE